MTATATVLLSSLGEIVTGSTPPAAHPEWFANTGMPFITPSDIQGGVRFVRTTRFLSDEGAKALKTRVLPPNTVCFVSIGATIGKMCTTTEPSVTNQQINSLIVNRDTVDPTYIYYVISQRADELTAIAGGSATPILNKSAFSAITVDVLPLAEQRAIAEVLGALDDKIETNRRVIDRVEHLARACAESSPDKVALGDVASVERNTRAPAMFASEEVDHYSIPAFDSMGLPIREIGGNIKSGKYEVTGTMVLVSKLNPHIPRVWYASTETGTLAIASTEFICVRPSDGVSPEELWACCSSSQFTTECQERVTGTTGSHQRVRPEDAMAVSIPDPRSLSDATRSTIGDTVVLASVVRREITRLADLRDALLPKLLSGELRVREAEELVEEAV